MKKRVPCYFDAATRKSLEGRFEYCFQTPAASGYNPILAPHDIGPGQGFEIKGGGGSLNVLPVVQQHGDIASLGFRFDNVAYSPDISGMAPESEEMLHGLDLWIVDALRPMPHPSHFGLRQALTWIERLAPKRAILTHMTAELDYGTLKRELPAHIEPAFDGMVVEIG